jgi:hypothetical protein
MLSHLPVADPGYVLLPPQRPSSTISNSLGNKIAICLSTRYDKPMATVRKYFSLQDVQQWGCVRVLDDGDDMHSSALSCQAEDRRDATFIRVSVIICTVPLALSHGALLSV